MMHTQTTPKHILVVDDNKINRELLIMALTQLGCIVVAVSNGQKALNTLSKKPYEFVFMDVEMPVMDGLEATRQLRQRSDITPQPIVIAYTANVGKAQQVRCREAGMDGFISKFVDLDELTTILENHSTWNSPGIQNSQGIGTLDVDAIKNLRRIVGDEPANFTLIINTFIENLMKQLTNLQNAAFAQDTEGMMIAAHSLKSLGNTFGAIEFSRISRNIELAAREGDMNTAKAQIPTLLQGVEPVVTALSQLKAEMNT